MKIYSVFVTVVVIILVVLLTRSCERNENNHAINHNLSGKLKVWRNHLNQVEAERNALTATTTQQLLEIKELKGTNKRLQETIKRDKNASTAISHDARTEIIYLTDNVAVIDTMRGYPVYHSAFHDEWKSGNITMGRDSLRLEINVVNKYDYKITRRKHWFKPDTIKVGVTNLNPHTTTTDLSAFTLIEKKKPWSVGPVVGCGFTADGNQSIFIGVGVQYSILKW